MCFLYGILGGYFMTRKNRRRAETVPVKYFDMEKASASGFCAFCRNNTPLIIAVSIAMVFTYGLRLFWYSIGLDTESFWVNKPGALAWFMQMGRYGQVFLSRLLFIREFNPFTAFFMAFCLIWLFTISWCYILAVFSRDTGRNNKLIPFALVFMTMPVWAEQFSFIFQATEVAFMVALGPWVVYLLFKGFLDNEKGKIACGAAMLVLMLSIYQAIIPMFLCGVFACFLLLSENTRFDSKVYRKLVLGVFAVFVGSLGLYFFIDRIVISSIFRIERVPYMENMIAWGRTPANVVLYTLLTYLYVVTIGNIPFVQSIAHPIIAATPAGMQGAEVIAHMSRIIGNVLLLPASVLFLVKVTGTMRKTIPSGRRLLYILAGIGVPLSILFLPLLGGNFPPIRALFVLPFACAFMLFYLVRVFRKEVAIVVAVLAVLTAGHQAQITAQLFYSDQLRYNEDVRIAHEINNMILQVQPELASLPVVIVGRYETTLRFENNFLPGEMLGASFFGVRARSVQQTTVFGLNFMRTLGMNFDFPTMDQMQHGLAVAMFMPAFPHPDSVMRIDDFIVVRISELLYLNPHIQ